jgi:hypothetical protein
MKVGKNLIARVWKEADLKPHALERFRASNDPQFEQKAADIIAFYLDPSQNARSSAWTRRAPFKRLFGSTAAWPLSPGRGREARLRVLPAGDALAVRGLESTNRRGHWQTAARHTSQEFVAFLEEVVSRQHAEQGVHFIPTTSPRTKRAGERVPSAASKCEPALHAHLFILAQSSRELVQQAPA